MELTLFDNHLPRVVSKCSCMLNANWNDIVRYYDELNQNTEHQNNSDDICTPMNCVKQMIDYIPDELWKRDSIKVLDPCSGNGNFGAYCKFKTNMDNIWFDEINPLRISNCKKILNPKNLFTTNALKLDSFGEWDLIMANPPYSGGGNKNRSLSNDFIEHSIKLLKKEGYLCFVTPNNWMTYNNNNHTLRQLLTNGTFLVIDNDAKKFFPKVGSSFTIFIWQKGVFNHKTYIKNNYLIKDEQFDVSIPKNLLFLPLYISQDVLSLIEKSIQANENNFRYRCDLHNHTRSEFLCDEQNEKFLYKTIHTVRKTRYASFKQDIYDKYLIIIPLSTYFVPYLQHNVNTTQSVGYFAFETHREAEIYLQKIIQPEYKVIIHLTRYGNFNNIMVLKHLKFDENILFTEKEKETLSFLYQKIKY